MSETTNLLETPDGRYIIVRGRLWRKTNPFLSEEDRKRLVADLLSARRAIKNSAADELLLRSARQAVDAAKIALGERGPDLNRRMVKTTPYSA